MCSSCNQRRQTLRDLSTKARRMILGAPILADILGHIVGRLAVFAANIIQEMPGLV
jgi:hypothetical protein